MLGTRIGRYEIRAPAGTGGMGEVYLAHDTQLQRAVALKLLPAEFALSAERLSRFQQEALAASSLNHPGILTIYEIGHSNGRHFIAAEFVEGVTLRERLQDAPIRLIEAYGYLRLAPTLREVADPMIVKLNDKHRELISTIKCEPRRRSFNSLH